MHDISSLKRISKQFRSISEICEEAKMPESQQSSESQFMLPLLHLPSTPRPPAIPYTQQQQDDLIARVSTLRLTELQNNKTEHPSGMLATISLKTLDAIVHPKEMDNRIVRLYGIFFIGASLLYLPWLFITLNKQALWFSLPFVGANLYANALVLLTLFNSWKQSSPHLFKLPKGAEVPIAVLLPTCGEPVDMLSTTIESVLTQQWPHDKLLL